MRKSYALLPVTQALIASELAELEATAATPTEQAWRTGQLAHKLDQHQRVVYDKYRAWELEPVEDGPGEMRRIFVLDIGRRWGKTFLVALIKIEDAERQPGSRHTFATAYAKDVAEILIPLFEQIRDDAPADCRPVFRSSKQGESAGYYFPNGSSIKLVGVDLHPRALRGRGSDGMAFTEAGYIKQLGTTVKRVVYPQFQRRPHARLILESNAPEEIDHDFDTQFIPDAKERGAYVFGTIDDNKALSDAEREEFIAAMGGRENSACKREYFGIRVRDESMALVPEFSRELHVGDPELPECAVGYVALDPGLSDKCAILWAYHDFDNARLVIQAAWAERNASSDTVAETIKRTEAELWGRSQLRYWNRDTNAWRDNPKQRVSDTDRRLLMDLRAQHGLAVGPANKLTAAKTELREAGLNSIRTRFSRNQILICPAATILINQLEAGRWNKKRTDYERTEQHGHFDAIDCLIYLCRAVNWSQNPNRPNAYGKVGARYEPYGRAAEMHAGERPKLLPAVNARMRMPERRLVRR